MRQLVGGVIGPDAHEELFVLLVDPVAVLGHQRPDLLDVDDLLEPCFKRLRHAGFLNEGGWFRCRPGQTSRSARRWPRRVVVAASSSAKPSGSVRGSPTTT